MAENPFHPSIDRNAADVRLLELLPGQKHDEISCNLFVVSLSENPTYEALSYVWGDKNDTFDVLLCGKKFPALKTLQVCLTELRYRERSRIMWIDSFCIDQNNDAERSHQVKLMAQIYRNAVKVIAWIHDRHNLTIEAINALRSSVDEGCKSPTQWATRDTLVRETIHQFHSFSMCSWWSRVWTLQEMVLAQDLEFYWCDTTGLIVITWRDFASACSALYIQFHYIEKRGSSALLEDLFTSNALFVVKYVYTAGKTLMFTDIAWLTLARQCTDPRDRIYGLLGLVADMPEMIVDYTMPVTKVYEKAIVESIRATESLGILLGRHCFSPIPGMASWATDWGFEGNSRILNLACEFSVKRSTLYSTGLFSSAQVAHTGQGRLICAGKVYDEIVTVFDTALQDNRKNLYVSIQKWDLMLKDRLDETYKTGITRYDAFWRSICGDCVSGANLDLGIDPAPIHTPRQKMNFQSKFWGTSSPQRRAGSRACHLFRRWWFLRGYEAVISLTREEFDFQAGVKANCGGKRMFLTKRGYIGIGHSVVQPGDHVAILLGSERPFVVRPVEPGWPRTEYTYHGPCYVHGIMDGEAVEELNLLPRPYPFLTLI